MKYRMLIIIALFSFVGCNKYETIPWNKLSEFTQHWKEPKVAIWYYQGSDNEFHYFHYVDLGVSKYYRVARQELFIDSSYALDNNSRKLRVMPWGPFSLIKR